MPAEGYSNSRLVDGVVLAPLTDIFAMPAWVPIANVFSVGDLLIGVGCAVAVVATMHGRGPVEPPTATAEDADAHGPAASEELVASGAPTTGTSSH